VNRIESNQTQFCKRLKYGNPNDPSVILGIIVSEDDHFIIFRTGRKQYTVSKSMILAIEDTDRVFRVENGDNDGRH